MWKIVCPDYNKAVNDDIDLLVSLNVITKAEKQQMIDLVTLYHSNNGDITEAQQNALSDDMLVRLLKGYKDDGLMYKGNAMADVSAEIYHLVGSCPYCGAATPETLDHFKHKYKWKSLALCRLNLVPVCWKCNSKKSTKDSSLFAHPYYTDFPKGVFLTAKCLVSATAYLFKFDFDPAVVTNKVLLSKLKTQWEKLELDMRLKANVAHFICSSVLTHVSDINSLMEALPNILNNTQAECGRNHWRSAVLRACIDEVNGANRDAFFTAITAAKNQSRDVAV